MAKLRPKQKQMCDKDVIIRGVQNCLDGMLKKTEGASPDQLELPSWWTRQTMIALCGWGLRKGFHVCASKMKDEADMIELAQKCGGKIQGEWLNDFTCLDHDDDGWLKRIPLVAESEWKDNKDEIEKDFKRLLAARADVRVMVFNGNRYRTDESRSSQGNTSIESGGLEKFTKYVNECEHTQAGDTYLLATRLHEGEGGISVNHRFDYFRFEAPSTTWSRPVRWS